MVIKILSGKPQPDKDPKDMGPAEQILYERYQRDEIKNMPFSLDDVGAPLSDYQIQAFPSISVDIMNRLIRVAERLQKQIRAYLLPEAEQLIYQHLAGVGHFVVSEVSGELARTRLGLSQLGSPKAIVLALNYLQQPREDLDLTSTFWHELTHVANPCNDKVNSYKYLAAFMGVYLNSDLEWDPHTENAIKNIRESVPRAFQGALFGTPICRNPLWRKLYQPVVKLVEADQITLFSPSPTREKTIMPKSIHPKLLPGTEDPDPMIPGFFVCYGEEDRPWVHTPLERGVYRWVREQAYQAAHDPDREWHGAVAEFLRLREGTHPDLDPAAIIFPGQPELYDPQDLDIDYSDMDSADHFAALYVCHPFWNDGESKPRDPKREAVECYKLLDDTIAGQERRVARRADYYARHPEEEFAPGY